MFILAELRDTVCIEPYKFKNNLNDAISTELNKKLSNKVLLNVGLCISLFDIIKIGDSFIFPGDGSSHTEVDFRYIVFRPFMEEILVGKIRSCSPEGIHVSLDFFEDILIPPNKLQHPSRFDETEQVWVWEYSSEENGKVDLFIDAGETIRFRVVNETFNEILPTGPKLPTADPKEKPETITKLPYSLIGAIDESGLGPTDWWKESK